MIISGEVVKTSQLPKKTLGLNDSLVALMSSPLETVTVPVSDFVSFVATQLLTASADSLDSVTTVGNTTANTITIGGATSPYYQLNTLSPGAQAVGRFVWNDLDGTADLRLKGGNVTLQVGQETVVRVVNKTNTNLLESEYKVVRVRIASEGGAQGQRLAVVLAQGNNDPDSVTTLGIVTENINNNQEGFITVFGNVSGINTTGTLQGETWADGDVLFLSPTNPGGLTKVKPVAPNHTVVMGYVVYAHQNNGKIFVKVDNGYELEELHDVLPTPYVNNGVLYRDTTANLWRSATIPTILGYTPSNASGTTNYVSKFTGTTTLGNSLVYDNGTNVGIGTTTPSQVLSVNGSISVGTGGGVISNSAGGDFNIVAGGASSNLNFYGRSFVPLRIFANNDFNYAPFNFNSVSSTNSFLGYFADWTGSNYRSRSTTAGVIGFNNGIWTITSDTGLTSMNTFTPTVRVNVSANGNVGIGTTSPSSTLTVVGGSQGFPTTSGTAQTGSFARFQNLSTNLTLDMGGNGGNGNWIQSTNSLNLALNYALMLNPNGGNILIGTTTDAGYKLDVNGTSRFQNTTNISVSGTAGTSNDLFIYSTSDQLTNYQRGRLYVTGNVMNLVSEWGGSANSLDLGLYAGLNGRGITIRRDGGASGHIQFNVSGNSAAGSKGIWFSNLTMSSTGLQYGMDFTGNVNQSSAGGYSMLRVSTYEQTVGTGQKYLFDLGTNTAANGAGTHSSVFNVSSNGSILSTGSITAASAIARGTYLNQTLVASANNDILAALDVAPTFTTGAFTGIISAGIRANTIIPRSANTGSIGFANVPYNNAFFGGTIFTNTLQNYDSHLSFSLAYVNVARFFTTTGNFLIQNGGTFTDSGYRLEVNGTTKLTATFGPELAPTLTSGNWSTTGGIVVSGSIAYTAGTVATAIPVTAVTPIIGEWYKVTCTVTGTFHANNIFSFGGTTYPLQIGTSTTYVNAISTLGFQVSALSTSNPSFTITALSIVKQTAGTGTLVVDGAVTMNNALSIASIGIGTGTTIPTAPLQVVDINGNGIRVTRNGVPSQYIAIHELGGAAHSIDGVGDKPLRINNTTSTAFGIEFYTQNSEKGRFSTAGNLLIGTATDAGYKLDVSGTSRFQGNVTLATGIALLSAGNNVNLRSNLGGGSGYVVDVQSYNNLFSTSLEQGFGKFSGTYAPTSITGPAVFNAIAATFTINQTGGANGVTRGLYINPILTSAADFRAIETTAGNVIISGGNLGIGITAPTDKLHIVDSSNANIFGRIAATGTNASAAWVAVNNQNDNVVYRVFGDGVSGSQMGISLVRSASLLANLGGTGKFLLGTFSATDFVMGTGNAEKVRIVDSTGNVLVGTTTDNGNKLQVAGTVDGQGFAVNGVPGYTGTVTIQQPVPLPPVVFTIQNGIITNVV